MTLLVGVVGLVLAHRTGYTATCSRTAHTVPTLMPVGSYSTSGAALACDGTNCTLSGSFRGFVVSASSVLTPTSLNAQSYDGGHCLTHRDPEVKTEVTFQVAAATSVWATVVLRNTGAQHTVVLVDPVAVAYPGRVYVVGAGAGGMAAARYLESVNVPVTVFERGPDVPPGFYSQSINNTYLLNLADTTTFTPIGDSPTLASFVGGNMNANGAVYKPGSVRDLALQTGVSEVAASLAQQIVAGLLDVDGDLMWRCIDESACDRGTVASHNTAMARRSVAFGESLSDLQVNKAVASVSSNGVELENGTTITLGPSDAIILAAGALMSPQLLGHTSFTGHNHYYRYSVTPGSIETQSFSYSGNVETNVANIGANSKITIRMLMEHDVVETFHANTSYTPSVSGLDFCRPDPPWTQCYDAWHYGGTVSHNNFLVDDRIYIGDASAIRRPFNCHTSVPAAAIGVMAGQSAVGMLPSTPLPRSDTLDTMKHNGPWYVAGGFLLVAGIAAHIHGRKMKSPIVAGKPLGIWLHYLLMWLAVVSITAGVVVSANRSRLTQKEDAHFVLGFIALGWLWAQAIAGSLVRNLEKKSKFRKVHRVSGVALLVLVAIVFLTVALRLDPFKAFEHNQVYADVSIAIVALLALSIVGAGLGLLSSAMAFQESLDGMERLM